MELGAAGRQRPRALHRSPLSIRDASTTEKVIFEDAAPLINTFYQREAVALLFCCQRCIHVALTTMIIFTLW